METQELDKNRINRLFREKGNDLLSVYYTAGFPGPEDTMEIARLLEEAGADIIEIGMPFSDPVADGPTIQASNNQALKNGMSIARLLSGLRNMREQISLPVILMGYINPVLQYGVEKFCSECEQAGVDGLILPDLPMAEYLQEYKQIFDNHGLKNVFLITPQTSEERIRQIDDNTDGFIYMVSSAATTGAKKGFSDEQLEYFERIRSMQLQNPLLIGFGISDHSTYSKANEYARGAIIGSAFIRLLSETEDKERDIKKFIKEIKGRS